MSSSKVAIVTGASSGIGRCCATALKEKGCIVYDFSRRDLPQAGIFHLSVDVTDEQAVQAAVETVVRKEGRLDIVINCAGFGISGAVEFTELAAAKRQFDVNFFGMVNVNKAAIPCLRESKGRIVNISSVAAVVDIPFQTYYSATKAAVNSYTCALANELKPFGVSVTAVMPGDIRTGFTGAREKTHLGDDLYGGRIGRSVAAMEKDEENGMAPEVAGRYIARIALKRKVKPLYAIGFAYKAVCVLVKLLPVALRNWIIGLLYAK